MKQQQRGLAVRNPDSTKPDKSLIPDKYNNQIEMKKNEWIEYFTKALLELRAQVFSDEVVSICANITAAVEQLIVCHKALPTYR